MRAIILGSSPEAPSGLARARRDHAAAVVTCNRGIYLDHAPAAYALIDNTACQLFGRLALAARALGSRLVTLQRLPSALKSRGVDHFDEFVREGHPYESFQLSGLWCIEYAIRALGATLVALAGMCGYRSGQHYFHSPSAREINGDLTETILRPQMPRLVAKYPAVQFVCYGQPAYQVDALNWEVR